MPRPSRIPEAIAYVRRNWKKGESLKEVAAKFGLDPGNLDRGFKHVEGLSWKTYVDKRRSQAVVELLKRDGMLGYEIAAELGFQSDFNFYRWVKRTMGVSFKHLKHQASSVSGEEKNHGDTRSR